MKADPEDLHNLAEDLKGVIRRHPDALHNNRDIADDLVKVRDKAEKRYGSVTEGRQKDSSSA